MKTQIKNVFILWKRGSILFQNRLILSQILKLYHTKDSLLNFVEKKKVTAIVRGIRSAMDFEYEKNIAETNRKLSGIETLFFLSDSKYSFISSGIVRELIFNRGDYSLFVPSAVKNSR